MTSNKEQGANRTIVIYGGSFDPPHIGHVAFCKELACCEEFDSIWIIPSTNHPFGKEMTELIHRFRMCELAFLPVSDRVEIRDEETASRGTGYTIDLIRYLDKTYSETRFVLALGSDNYAQRHKWKDFDIIEQLVDVQFFGRKGWKEANNELDLETPFPEVSSSEMRNKIRSGEIPSHLLPPGIPEYIMEHQLYKAINE